MTTETINKPASPFRVPSTAVRTEPPPKKVSYEPGYVLQPVVYPESDGQPMAETDFQFVPLCYGVESLKIRFQDRPDVYVAGNIFFYYEEDNPKANVSPDVLVMIGAEKRMRRTIKLWEEPKAPDFILEITSSSTRSNDQGIKKGLYAYLGVTEYFCYDPTGDYLDPPLCGYRLEQGVYVPIPPKIVSPYLVIVPSQVLGLDLQMEGREFRFVDPLTGKTLRSFAESEQQLAESEQQLAESEAARFQAEARIRELEVQLAALRKPN